MFCKGGGQTKNFRPFCQLTKQNALSELCPRLVGGGGGQTNVCGVFGDGMQGRSS